METWPPRTRVIPPRVGWVTENEPAWEEELTVSVDDLFPSEDALEPWQWLEAEELMRWLLSWLSTQPALQRRAFVLNVLEGLSEEEIAMLQGRHVQQVREDIKTHGSCCGNNFRN